MPLFMCTANYFGTGTWTHCSKRTLRYTRDGTENSGDFTQKRHFVAGIAVMGGHTGGFSVGATLNLAATRLLQLTELPHD